ncbi:MAG: PCRF domain-containing protein, partial [Actinobacteria bacterium]|nr:PCRF domain-containing protein [Actinomycetota bacterium]
MITDRTNDIAAVRQRVDHMAEYLHLEAKRAEVALLEDKTAQPGFWDDQNIAQATMASLSVLRDEIQTYEAVVSSLEDTEVANELALSDADEDMAAEVEVALRDLSKQVNGLEVSSWFTGKFDAGDAILTITPGQGGLEAQDWTEMLFKMYTKYAESKRWKIDLHDAPAGVELGLDRAVFTVHGRNAYGMLASEVGVHRLVRISPTDEKKRRQTTFAGVEVLPVLPS